MRVSVLEKLLLKRFKLAAEKQRSIFKCHAEQLTVERTNLRTFKKEKETTNRTRRREEKKEGVIIQTEPKKIYRKRKGGYSAVNTILDNGECFCVVSWLLAPQGG